MIFLLTTSHPVHGESALWPLVFVAAVLWYFFFGISRMSGWHQLAERFRAPEPWTGQRWGWQSARFRGWFGYNNCLVFGADPHWLSISMARFFGGLPQHPALLIPWNEIEVETGTTLFGLSQTATLRIGSQERVSVRIYGKLVGRLRQAAGAGWPLYHQEQGQGTQLYS